MAASEPGAHPGLGAKRKDADVPVHHRHRNPPIGPEHDPKAAISIHDVTVAYHRRPVLWDLDLDIPRGVLAAVSVRMVPERAR